jgi:hypothetical protein
MITNHDEPQQQKTRVGVTGKGFVKGDPRINRSGRPRSFDELRRTAQRIAAEPVIDAAGNSLTRIEQLLRQWARSKQPALQLASVAYCYGKPAEKIETTGFENKPVLILHYAHEFDRVEALRRGLQPPDDDNGASLRLKGP